jgi:hypothetical protein
LGKDVYSENTSVLIAYDASETIVNSTCRTYLNIPFCWRFCVLGSLPKLQEKLGDLAPSLLPAEYGGDTPLSHHTAQWAEHLERMRPTLLNLDTMKIQPKQVAAPFSLDGRSFN